MQGGAILYAVLAALILALAATVYFLLRGKDPKKKRIERLLSDRPAVVRADVTSLSADPRTRENIKRQIALQKGKKSKQWLTIRRQLDRAESALTVRDFWMLSATVGLFAVAGWMALRLPTFALPAVFIVFAFGAPRVVLAAAVKRRQKKFTAAFADAVDVIVRGVRSGLPLGECLAAIARDSEPPLRGLFTDLVEAQRVGLPLRNALDRFVDSMPTNEARFFATILTIQQQTGGNLAETLSNLSGVLRARKTMRDKVKAMSAEARMSAMIIGALPVVVSLAIYVLNPEYMSSLWTTLQGRMMLGVAAGMMFTGVMTMRKMINFEI